MDLYEPSSYAFDFASSVFDRNYSVVDYNQAKSSSNWLGASTTIIPQSFKDQSRSFETVSAGSLETVKCPWGSCRLHEDDTDNQRTESLREEDCSDDEVGMFIDNISKKQSQDQSICESLLLNSSRNTETVNHYEKLGRKQIENAVFHLFSNSSLAGSLIVRATEIYKKSVELQQKQKEISCDQKPCCRRRDRKFHCRVRFARQKAFLVTSIIIAMKQLGLQILTNKMTAKTRDRHHIKMISQHIEGTINVSINSVKGCCRDLGYTSFCLS